MVFVFFSVFLALGELSSFQVVVFRVFFGFFCRCRSFFACFLSCFCRFSRVFWVFFGRCRSFFACFFWCFWSFFGRFSRVFSCVFGPFQSFFGVIF